MKPSDIYFAGLTAALQELPAVSKALIFRHDLLHKEWGKVDYRSPIPPELAAASEAARADPLAAAALKLREIFNTELLSEIETKLALDD